MPEEYTIYLKQELQRVTPDSSPPHLQYRPNYTALYDATECHGPNKRAAVENMIRELRRMHANGNLITSLATPESFEAYDRCIIPAHVIEREESEFIDYEALKFEASEENN